MSTNVIHAEWIGKHAAVKKSTNQNLVGIQGVVVDETRNAVVIETANGTKRVPKHGTVFEIEGQEVQGEEILVAPDERIKLKVD